MSVSVTIEAVVMMVVVMMVIVAPAMRHDYDHWAAAAEIAMVMVVMMVVIELRHLNAGFGRADRGLFIKRLQNLPGIWNWLE
jgi:hypothetical protein